MAPKAAKKKTKPEDEAEVADVPKPKPAKKKGSTRAEDFELLGQEHKKAREERIKKRLLNALMIGVVLDAFSGEKGQKKDQPSGSGKKGSGVNKPQKTAAEYLATMYYPLMWIGFICVLLYLRQGSSYGAEGDQNHYEVLGISPGASDAEIKRAYKKLALEMHPDKNPNCSSCAVKFAAIGVANSVLSDPEKKSAYDSGKSVDKTMDSTVSTKITDANVESLVMKSNDVWMISIVDKKDGACHHWHPLWEETALELGHLAKFGRVDINADNRAAHRFGIRPQLLPTILRVARGEPLEIFPLSEGEEGLRKLKNFVREKFPDTINRVSPDGVQGWATQGTKPKVLLTGGGRSERSRHSMLGQRWAAHKWEDDVDVALVDTEEAARAARNQAVFGGWEPVDVDEKFAFILKPGETAFQAQQLGQMGSDADTYIEKLDKVLSEASAHAAPYVHRRNAEQLCKSRKEKRYCLILVDAVTGEGSDTTTSVDVTLKDLTESRAEFLKEDEEAAAAKGDDEEGSEDSDSQSVFEVQAVRLNTRKNRIGAIRPPPDPATSVFYSWWTSVGAPPAILVELDSKRYAPLKRRRFFELYQSVAYDDIQLQDLPDEFNIDTWLPDMDATVYEELVATAQSPLGMVFLFVLFLVTVAVLPEVWDVAQEGFQSNAVGYGAAAVVGLYAVLWIISPAFHRAVFALLPGPLQAIF